ncbi:MAG: NAD-dependent epimerase/dehydratase family protein, partial [Planctomycetia bacterium]
LNDAAALLAFAGKSVLVTGGLGFLGSSLAVRLVDLGARVCLLDVELPESGANWFNLHPAADRIAVTLGDVRDRPLLEHLCVGQDYIFHAAAQTSHVLGLRDPFPDLDINIQGTASLLEGCRRSAPTARIVRLGSRGQYGPVDRLPANEDAPQRPRGVYELSLTAAENLADFYHRAHGLAVTSARLANVYGPRGQMLHPHAGVANWFVRLALDGVSLPLFGDGTLRRAFVYVDAAVDALLRLAACPNAAGQSFNVGDDRPSHFRELAETLAEIVGANWHTVPFAPERQAQEPGDYYSSIAKIQTWTGWRPTTSLREGVARTTAYYRDHRRRYWSTNAAPAARPPGAVATPRLGAVAAGRTVLADRTP